MVLADDNFASIVVVSCLFPISEWLPFIKLRYSLPFDLVKYVSSELFCGNCLPFDYRLLRREELYIIILSSLSVI